MTTKGATAEIFWTAFKALPKGEQEAVVARLLGDREFVEDLMDIARIEQARCEPGKDAPLRDYTASRNKIETEGETGSIECSLSRTRTGYSWPNA